MSSRTLLLSSLLMCSAACAADEPGPGNDDTGVTDGKADGATAPRLGATLDATGTTFAVWAPNADAVLVTGDFNDWSRTAAPLARGAGGVWSAHVAGAAAGDEYLYVIQRGASTVERIDPRAARVTSSQGHAVVHDPNSYRWQAAGYQTPPWHQQVVYELHVGTFNDTPGGAPGTFTSAIERLDHLRELGVNVVEVMPVGEFAGDYSWGYNGAFPLAPESAYGAPDDFKRFVDQAHARGIAVILDVVNNHWGPSDLSMWCFDIECYGAGGIYFYTDWRLESGWGPRPDFGRTEVRDAIVDNAMTWLREYRVDGLRWDSTVNIRSAGGRDLEDGWRMLQQANDRVDGAQSWKIMIAEDLQGNDWITRPTHDGGAGFDAQWDGAFFHPIDDAIIAASDSARDMTKVRAAIAGRTNRVIYTESHDEVANGKQRIPEMIWPGNAGSYYARKRSTLGAAIALTSPGIPMLFQGQELLEDGWFTDTDPVDWSKRDRFGGIVAMYRDLIRLRRNLGGVSRGLTGGNVNVFHVNDTDKVIAYHRWDQGGAGDDVIVVANFSGRAFSSYDLGLPRGGTWKVRFNGDASVYSADFGNTASFDTQAWSGGRDGLAYHGTVGIGPYSVVILSQ
jgi:1,4-alpha-glucan branching enzyme